MGVIDLYSKRKRRVENAGQPDVYQYESIQRPLRVRIIQIWSDAIGECVGTSRHNYGLGPAPPNSDDWWNEIHSALAREKGVFTLEFADTGLDRCAKYLQSGTNTEDILDTVEVTFRWIQHLAELDEWEWEREARERNLKQRPAEALAELNYRLRESGVGFQFQNGQIICVDNQYIHAEAVKPALVLLSDDRFRGPHEEFLHAHELYRTAGPEDHKQREDVIAGALKAFESTLKVVCDLKKWPRPDKATAAPLIKTVIDNGLIPSFLQSSMEGLATLRNNVGGHGQGAQMRSVPPHLAAYGLHLVAASIVMLVEAFKTPHQSQPG